MKLLSLTDTKGGTGDVPPHHLLLLTNDQGGESPGVYIMKSNLLEYWECSEQEENRYRKMIEYPKGSVSVTDIMGRLASCCTTGAVFKCRNNGCHKAGTSQKGVYSTCGISICEKIPCLKARIRRRRKKYMAFVKHYRMPKFLTLTIKGYFPLSMVIKKKLDEFWKVFSQWARRRNYFWAYFKSLEIVPHEYVTGEGLDIEYHTVYYYHFHVLYDGKRIPVETLRSEWLSITGDSYIIGISEVNPFSSRSRIKVVSYVCNYVSKASYLELEPDEYLYFRKARFFGSWKHKTLKWFYNTDAWKRYIMRCDACDERLIYSYSGEVDNFFMEIT